MNADNVKNNAAEEKNKDGTKAEVKAAKEATRSTGKSAAKGDSKAAVKTGGKAAGKVEGKASAKNETKTKSGVKAEPKAKAVPVAQEKSEEKLVVKSVSRLKVKYDKEVVPALIKEMNYTSVMQVPRLQKIVINIGLGEAIENSQAQEMALKDLTAIAGQKPVITRAKKSIAAFKLRQGMPIGVMVTLRASRMYEFLDKLVNVTLPRSRDFQGVPSNSFDGRGNYTLGIREQTTFPEIDYSRVDKVRGMEISIVTSARTDEEGRHLLRLLGMPFKTSDRVEEEKKRG